MKNYQIKTRHLTLIIENQIIKSTEQYEMNINHRFTTESGTKFIILPYAKSEFEVQIHLFIHKTPKKILIMYNPQPNS